MELNLYALKTFKEVVEQQSFSKAAQVLFLTQPAVSLQIKSLENYFQTPLLVRGNAGNIQLTQEGEVVYTYSNKLVDLLHELNKNLSKNKYENSITLHMAVCYIGGENFLADILKKMKAQHPNARVSLSVLKCENIFYKILSGIFDLGITGLPPHDKNLSSTEIGKVPLTLFKEYTHQNGDEPVSIKTLLETPLLLREPDSGVYKEFIEFLKSKRLALKHFHNIYFFESNQAIKSMVKSGIGFSVLPRFLIQKELQTKEISPIILKEGELQQRFYLTYRKQDEFSSSMLLMLNFIQDSIKESWAQQEEKRTI